MARSPRSFKRLHVVAFTGVLGCLLLAVIAGARLLAEWQGTLTGMALVYVALVLLALIGIALINITLFRTLGAVRHDIRALVQMFNDVHQGNMRPDYPVEYTEFAAAQRYLRGWGRELVAEKQRLTDLGLVDHLSQLSNRRHFEMRLKEIFDNARTHGPSSVLVIDADRFKQVNDNHGHDAGDRLIVRLGAALRANVRHPDVLARIGGDEFCIVYAYTLLPKAHELAERLRQALPRMFELKPGVQHTLCWTGGLSIMQTGDAKADDVLRRADQALRHAKEAGRNRTAVFDPDAGTAESPLVASS